MPNVEDFNLCPLGRIRHPLNQQKVRIWRNSGRKNKCYYVRSRNAYENKENVDIMPGPMQGIYARSVPFLRKIAGLEGQFTRVPCRIPVPKSMTWSFPVTNQRSGRVRSVGIHKSARRHGAGIGGFSCKEFPSVQAADLL